MKELWTSASQLETHGLCKRKWWFLYAKKLPTFPKTHFAFGTILHEVCERYLLADYLGRDADGKPVDLYPDGWHINGDYELPPADQTLIKALVDRAIEEGILMRQDGEVEAGIKRQMDDGIVYVGKIDHLCPDGIEDHKTTKSTRWALSAEGLSKNRQMLLYAREWLQRKRETKQDIPETIRLQHNVFIKDFEAPKVRKTIAYVEPAQVDSAWENAIEQAREMVLDRQVEDWQQFEDPEPGACMKYGGCEFRSICGRRESMDRYISRVNANKTAPEASFFEKVQGLNARSNENVMALKKRLSDRARPFAQINTPVDREPETPATEAPPSTADEDESLPPWAVKGCAVCYSKHPGFNSSGNFCRACLSKTNYDVGVVQIVTTERSIDWSAPEGEGSVPFVNPVKVKQSSIFESKPLATGSDFIDMTSDFDDDDGDSKSPVETLSSGRAYEGLRQRQGKRGRPPAGPKLLIGVMPVKGVRPERVQLAQDVLMRFGDMLANSKQVPSYYSLPAYERRSAIASEASKIAEALGSDYILVTNPDNPDIEAMISALIPYCEHIFTR